MVAWYPGGPRSSGRSDDVCGADASEVRAETAELSDTADVGVHDESKGLAYVWPYDGGRPSDDDAKDEPDDDDAMASRRGRPLCRRRTGEGVALSRARSLRPGEEGEGGRAAGRRGVSSRGDRMHRRWVGVKETSGRSGESRGRESRRCRSRRQGRKVPGCAETRSSRLTFFCKASHFESESSR